MIKLVGLIKSLSFKFVNHSFIFDVAEYDYDHKIALYMPKFKESV